MPAAAEATASQARADLERARQDRAEELARLASAADRECAGLTQAAADQRRRADRAEATADDLARQVRELRDEPEALRAASNPG
jgi:hypothetical protein